jgi:ATP synthase subunit 6
MYIYNPLEQFEVITFDLNGIDWDFGLFYIYITNNIYLFFQLILFLYMVILFFSFFETYIIPTKLQVLIEFVYNFVYSILNQQAGFKGRFYFPIIFLTFFFILFSNLIGLFPLSFTLTSHIFVTFFLAFSFNFGMIILGFYKHNIKFLLIFVPKGAPKVLLPLIIIIEVISYLLRTFSLSVRLFANMMAGHTLLHILSSFVLQLQAVGYSLFSLFPFIITLMVMVLELAIALIQAYVFVILISIYLKDSLDLH